MGVYLNPGNSGFTGIRNDTYVDKSGMISLINDTIDTPRRLTCVSRPRRFGKSFAAKMLCAYYDKTCDSSALFDDLKIASDGGVNGSYKRYLNRYDVIYIDMTNIMGAAGSENIISFIQESVTKELLDTYPDLTAGQSFDETLIHAVELTENKFIMIIDEWDAPIREIPEIQQMYLKFLRTLFKSSGTTDRIFAAAYMTGILPVKKDGSQSAISDFKEFTAVKPRKFGEYVGFTEEEVQKLCRDFQCDFGMMKQWYDGYSFRDIGSVYNPNSVMEAIRNDDFDSYWTQTSAAESLIGYISLDFDGLSRTIAELIGGGEVKVDTRGFANDLVTFRNRNDVLTLLIHLGYLTYDETTGRARIPNEEIRMEFSKIVRDVKRDDTLKRIDNAPLGGVKLKKCFNVYGPCYPDENYMVNLDERMMKIKKLVDNQKYFVINRARQYGKTTTLWALKQYLKEEYNVLSTNFQRMSSAVFCDEHTFSREFANMIVRIINNKKQEISGFAREDIRALERASDDHTINLADLFYLLSNLCETSKKPVVLIIDEVDSVSNNQVFLDFLGLLRGYYLDRKQTAIFHSVILAGVYDIKNLKQKLRPNEVQRYNSPWNIAADFDVDMSFSVRDIEGMLSDYEKDHQTGMNIERAAEVIYDYTFGYPYLVSRICMLLDEQAAGSWSETEIAEAVTILLNESNTLFDDMRKQITGYPELKKMLYAILFYGQSFAYNPDNYVIDIGKMFGFLRESDGQTVVANRIFETRIYNLFLSEELVDDKSYKAASEIKNQFIQEGHLNMDVVMTKFMQHFTDVYDDSSDTFKEENGRRLFLLYLKPIINGKGNYYIEAQTRNQRRTDVVIDYLGQQQVVEMKIWRGEEYNRRGEEQFFDYLEYYHLDKGYLLSFNFNKKKQIGMKEIKYKGKRILEVVV